MEETRSIGSHLSERVRRYREALGLRQEDLAERMTQLGHPTNRVTLAKIEKGGTRAGNASLVDVLVLAAALDVPPPLLFLPLGDAEQVAISAKLVTHPQVVLEWIAGEDDLRDVVPWPSVEAWHRNSQTLRLFNGLRERQNAVTRADGTLAGLKQTRSDPLPGIPRASGEAVAAARARFDRALIALDAHREAMRSVVSTLPELPAAWASRLGELDQDS